MNIIFIKRDKADQTKACNNLVTSIRKANSVLRICAQKLSFLNRLENEMSVLSKARLGAANCGLQRGETLHLAKERGHGVAVKSLREAAAGPQAPALPQLCCLSRPETLGKRRRSVLGVTLAWH